MSTPVELESGSVFGRYVLVEPIGSGAMGDVWVAIDPDLDRKIALKLLRRNRTKADDNPRLIREARAMARLSHANVAAVHDVGEVDGRVFIAMEFVAGESLSEFIERGPHPWTTVLPLLRQAGAGLAAAHQAGIIHRDFKPANVLLGTDGRVRVVDFGLAASDRRERPEEVAGAGHTLPPDRKDAGVGTPAYMASEQHRGEGFDARSDQFAFCVTAFELLYGRRPFPGEFRYAVALAIVEGRLSDVPAGEQAPAWIHKAILRGLSVEPSARFPDIAALLAALSSDPASRRRRLLFAGASVGLVATAIGWWLLLPPPVDPCADAASEMTATWSSARRAKLDAWLTEGGSEPWRGRASESLLAGIDARADAWTATAQTVCSDRVTRRATERLLAERTSCLEQQRQVIDTLASLPGDASGGAQFREHLLARPFAALRAIGVAEPCGELVQVSDDTEPERRLAIARAELWLAIQLPKAAQAALASFPCAIESDPPCESRLGLAHARTLAQNGEAARAAQLFEQVAPRALRNDPAAAVAAWTELARLSRSDGVPSPIASDWIEYAGTLAEQLPGVQRIEVGLAAAELELASARPQDAKRRIDSTLAMAREQPTLDADLEAELLRLRARAHRDSKEFDAALVDEADARERVALALGAGHPAAR